MFTCCSSRPHCLMGGRNMFRFVPLLLAAEGKSAREETVTPQCQVCLVWGGSKACTFRPLEHVVPCALLEGMIVDPSLPPAAGKKQQQRLRNCLWAVDAHYYIGRKDGTRLSKNGVQSNWISSKQFFNNGRYF